MKIPANTHRNVSRLSHKELQLRLEKASTTRPRIRVGGDQPFYREYSSILVSFLFFLLEERRRGKSWNRVGLTRGCKGVRMYVCDVFFWREFPAFFFFWMVDVDRSRVLLSTGGRVGFVIANHINRDPVSFSDRSRP